MKLKLLLVLMFLGYLNAEAQDNPYAIFGYKSKVVYKDNPKDAYRMTNSDTLNLVRYLEFDITHEQVRLYDKKGTLMQTQKIEKQELLRWTSVDPLADKYPSLSPYNYATNNPVKVIDPDGRAPKDIVTYDMSGQEVSRVQSNTVFETRVIVAYSPSGVPGYDIAPMPNIIASKGGANTTGPAYQEHDYQIAAATKIFNIQKNDGPFQASGSLQLYTDGNSAIPRSANAQIPDLDPTLVKAVAMQESALGQGRSGDIMTANATGDWGSGFKANYGLSKGVVPNAMTSLSAGIKELATKGFRGGVSYDSSTGQKSFTFQGWNSAVDKYNGNGTAGYASSVLNMYNNSQKPKPSNYVVQ